LELRIQVDAGEDPEQRDDLTRRLRAELLQLDVERVEVPAGGDAPPGARAVDIAAIGELIVTVGQSATAIGAVVGLVQSWLSRTGRGTIEITTSEGDSVKVSGRLSPEQRELLQTFVDRQTRAHGGDR
jgi:membrane-associated two-gene conflict system component 1 (EACC1)